MAERVYTDPFFWALVSLFGLQGGTLIVSDHRVGRSIPFVVLMLTLVTLGRFLLVLPFCPQPRFDLGSWNAILGGLVLLVALVVALPTLRVQWWRAPQAGMHLRTTGMYALVRHPMYLSEVLWPSGWSLLWGSTYGLALTPLWWLGFLFHVLIEEAQLERQLGSQYTEYKRRVRGRILPGLPL